MTSVEATVFFSCVVGAVCVSWLLGNLRRNIRQDRKDEGEELNDLDGLRWNGWSPLTGWPPVTCWHGCQDLHRDDWWREYLGRSD